MKNAVDNRPPRQRIQPKPESESSYCSWCNGDGSQDGINPCGGCRGDGTREAEEEEDFRFYCLK